MDSNIEEHLICQIRVGMLKSTTIIGFTESELQMKIHKLCRYVISMQNSLQKIVYNTLNNNLLMLLIYLSKRGIRKQRKKC